MARTLVVFFSRSGTTAQVAEHLARALSADLERIVEPTSRSGLRGYVRSLLEARMERVATTAPVARDPGTYDLVVIGTPVWAASMSSPVRSYLHRNRDRLRRVAFFCTMGGRGAVRVLDQMAQLTEKRPAGTLALLERDVRSGRADAAMDAFVGTLESAKVPVAHS